MPIFYSARQKDNQLNYYKADIYLFERHNDTNTLTFNYVVGKEDNLEKNKIFWLPFGFGVWLYFSNKHGLRR